MLPFISQKIHNPDIIKIFPIALWSQEILPLTPKYHHLVILIYVCRVSIPTWFGSFLWLLYNWLPKPLRGVQSPDIIHLLVTGESTKKDSFVLESNQRAALTGGWTVKLLLWCFNWKEEEMLNDLLFLLFLPKFSELFVIFWKLFDLDQRDVSHHLFLFLVAICI